MKTVIVPLQTVTTTGALTGADVSGIGGDFTLSVRVVGLTGSSGTPPGARIVIEETLDAWAHSSPVMVLDVRGPGQYSVKQYQVTLSKIGYAGALLRARIDSLVPGSGASVQFEAWIDS